MNLLNLIFPKFCLNCHTIGSYICNSCQKLIIRHKQICIICNYYSPLGATHPKCLKHSYLDGIIIATQYKTLSKKALFKIKHDLSYDIIDELLQKTLISDQIKKCLFDQQFELVTEVPMHINKRIQKGFNQSAFIAQWVQKYYTLPHTSLLQKQLQTTPQKDLSRHDRLFNLNDAFSLISSSLLPSKSILLVDDVTTTGSTLQECAKVLKNNGTKKVWGLVIASGK